MAEHRLHTRRRHRFTVTLAVLLSAGTAGAGTVAWNARAGRHETASEQPVPLHTTKVARTALSTRRTTPGTLGYSRPLPLRGKGAGTVTGLPSPGARAARGKPLYWV